MWDRGVEKGGAKGTLRDMVIRARLGCWPAASGDLGCGTGAGRMCSGRGAVGKLRSTQTPIASVRAGGVCGMRKASGRAGGRAGGGDKGRVREQ